MASSILSRLAEIEASGVPAALVTVVKVSGSTPRGPGARMIVHPDGRIEGSIGGGQVERTAIDASHEVLVHGEARLVEHALTQELGMCCGGQVTLFVERIAGAPTLLVFGAGHVGVALTRAAAAAGFSVHVADEREDMLTEDRLERAHALYDDVMDPALPYAPDAYVMIATHDQALDQRLLERAVGRPHRWLGVISSRRKAELAKKRLLAKGVDPEVVAAVRAPVGLAIGAETAEEIAVAILAELIAVRRGASLDDGALEHKRPRAPATSETPA